MIKTQKNWYAIYTRPRWEKKVAELLTEKNIENYCPLNKVERYWSDRKKIVLEPLFTSYVFVHATEQEHLEIIKTHGVINFVYFLARPAIIRAEEIETIRHFLSEYKNVKLDKCAVKVNDHVRIVNGAFTNHKASVIEMRHKTVVVYLPSLGHKLVAEINKADIELLNNTETRYAKNA